MEIKNEMPRIFQSFGSGKFYIKSKMWYSKFRLILYPQTIRLFANFELDYLDYNVENWTIRGELEDGRKIYCNSLSLINATKYCLEFMPLKKFFIGKCEEKPIRRAEFPLIGFYGAEFEVIIDNWKIKFEGKKEDLKNQKRLSKIWKIQLEGLTMQMQKENEQQFSYTQTAIQIIDLLSLATGNAVIFNKQRFYYDDDRQFDIWRPRLGNNFGVYECVPEYAIRQFIRQTYPTWKNLDNDDTKLINNAVNYINSTAFGYLEDRVFRITQAWESVANKWVGDINNLSDEIKDLKNRLKNSLRDWRKEFPNYDKDGFYGNRVINALTWNKAIDKTNLLASKFRLDLEKLKIDFQRLFELRNAVAHNGKFKKKENPSELSEILENARFGLQVLFLKKLKYSDLVISPRSGYTIKIDEFLTNVKKETSS